MKLQPRPFLLATAIISAMTATTVFADNGQNPWSPDYNSKQYNSNQYNSNQYRPNQYNRNHYNSGRYSSPRYNTRPAHHNHQLPPQQYQHRTASRSTNPWRQPAPPQSARTPAYRQSSSAHNTYNRQPPQTENIMHYNRAPASQAHFRPNGFNPNHSFKQNHVAPNPSSRFNNPGYNPYFQRRHHNNFWGNSGPGAWMNPNRHNLSQGWDDMLNAPSRMGDMPGGWSAPSVSMPNPVDVGDQFKDNARNLPDQMRNMNSGN